MKGTKDLKINRGITLIALVITIIVMLILVAVTITMAVNGGLFEYAGNAGTKTNGAIANEQELANLEDNMTVNQLIDKYTGGTEEGNEGVSTPTIKDCENCTNGIIEGYWCSNCESKMSRYEEVWMYCASCSKCGYKNFSEAGDYEYITCADCSFESKAVWTRELYGYYYPCCEMISSEKPALREFPCPTCK